MPARVILYELNEVPWEIVDLYVRERPSSVLARLLPRSASFTTINEDDVPFQPWRTWPTFHTSTYTREHNSFDLGQDPHTFRAVPLWDVADEAGLSVGLFGPLQSWPARPFRSGGFHVPDTFARAPDTFPSSLRQVQAFNLEMTRRNGFASDAALPPTELVRAGLAAAARGLTPWSAWRIAGQLVRERRDARYRAARANLQVLLCFDLFWRLHRRHRPHLSIFFTNHVAGMMHRFWGDTVEGYAADGYQRDEVFAGFVFRAMDDFDRQLGRMARWLEGQPDTVLVVASSMGQHAIPYREIDRTYVLDEPGRLIERLGLEAEVGLTMYPQTSIQFADVAVAEAAVERLRTVAVGERPMFADFQVRGTTVSFQIDFRYDEHDLESAVVFGAPGSDARVHADLAELGISIRRRPGGGNTAYHCPEGIFIAFGSSVVPNRSRRPVSVLDAAPSILASMHLTPPSSMWGAPSLAAALGA